MDLHAECGWYDYGSFKVWLCQRWRTTNRNACGAKIITNSKSALRQFVLTEVNPKYWTKL
ncbi:hypothetical protein A4W81_09150 [Latilactobacillus sakei]|nr:hypothetical protein A4W81_09150 [Latilactobacillus sakei]